MKSEGKNRGIRRGKANTFGIRYHLFILTVHVFDMYALRNTQSGPFFEYLFVSIWMAKRLEERIKDGMNEEGKRRKKRVKVLIAS